MESGKKQVIISLDKQSFYELVKLIEKDELLRAKMRERYYSRVNKSPKKIYSPKISYTLVE